MVCCPWHGELAPEQEYVAGRALCGCEFQPAAGGKLRAVQPAAVEHEGGPGNGEAAHQPLLGLAAPAALGAQPALLAG